MYTCITSRMTMEMTKVEKVKVSMGLM
jgi:hypothetical protein